ncbi:zinc finger protein 37-like isoform X2 [Cheilinus undulatus]|uniref:zinc finger protein 37-like isoform X2 n=1 Tax=Cheilinus undulatus TaxID=241271 RepID=UPI001BD4CDFF|nr:zinc finger protein 37-like isoform X2 [Cheilinus undulatus]
MSKGETLRGFVTERLSAVSQEILAVVDGIVAEYEAEASGFREEIDRQRKQLEVLLEPQLTANQTDGRRSKRLLDEEKCDDEEDGTQEDLTNTNPSRVRFKKRRPGRPQISETQNHIALRIRILEDPKTSVLSNNILKKCPLLKLNCPRGLQEKDFLDLLRSTFPQLSGDDKHFDILTSDQRRRLEPLKLTTVTPEEIHRLMSCTESKKSPIYVRLKESQANQDGTDPLQKKDSRPASAVLICDESRLQTSPVQDVGGSRGEVSSSSTSHLKDMGTGDGNENDGGIPDPCEDLVTVSAAKSKVGDSDPTEEEDKRGVNDSDDDWKPDKDVEELKESDSELFSETPKRQKPRRSGVKTNENRAEDRSDPTCKVCAALQKSEVTLVKHAWIHVEDSGTLCGVCGELLASVEELEEHLAINHRTDDCDICGESFLDNPSFNEHVAAHSGEKPYECDVCSERFALTVSLENHRKLHQAEKLHKCHTCNKVFELRSQLKAHRMTHTHLCGVCGKSLSDYRSLSRHKMTHTGERPHSCKVCGRSFKLPGTLRQHEKIHTDRERSYLCDVCCKMFLTSKQLQIHMRTHTNEKPYHCGECGRGFTTKGPLTVHMRVHTGETPYRCPDCGWSFKRKVHLDNHVTVHSDLKPFVCGICGKACARKVYLKVHMRTHNGERPYKCNLCDKAFTQSHCLKTHMKSHLVTEITT